MNERLVCKNITLVVPDETAGLGALEYYETIPVDLTIVAVSVAPSVDDAGATIDINDDGTGVIEGVDASDQNVAGTWTSTHFGGTNDPVTLAADSVMTLDANNAAVGTAIYVTIWALTGEASA